MPKRNLTNRIKRWLRNTLKQLCNAIATFVRRSLGRRRRRHPRRRTAGFLLPTTALLLLLMSLVVGALLIRTFNRTEQVVGAREQRVIYNATSPAIERAKAKLEYIFSNDPRVTSGVPSQEVLTSMMLNDGDLVEEFLVDGNDPYTLPDETRLDINGGGDDTAWSFPVDLNGDGAINEGEDGRVAYSIVWQVPLNGDNGIDASLFEGNAETLAEGNEYGPYVRRGPIIASSLNDGCNLDDDIAPPIENGWFSEASNTATLRKNFQIDAVLIPDDPNVTTQATLEVQQERQSNRGNKWGAWFRTDLEVDANPPFRFNGAMHTEGSYFLTKTSVGAEDGFQSYLVSSVNSCLYRDPSASELTINEVRADENDDTSTLLFQGQAVNGWTLSNEYTGDAVGGAGLPGIGGNSVAPPIHLKGNDPDNPRVDLGLLSLDDADEGSDSVQNTLEVADLMLNPLAVVTENKSRAFSQAPDPSPDNPTPYPGNIRSGSWAGSDLNGRIVNVSNPSPFIDDTYRADGRLGPKPTYGRNNEFTLEELGPNGTPIADVGGEVREALTKMQGTGSDDVGLDGYWERRAVNGGMRIVVGQRLELGDPLEPLDPADRNEDNYPNHYERQRRTLRDNPAAVQATAIYHSAHDRPEDGGTPYAALISTVHPGTPDTLARSATFDRLSFAYAVKSDYTSLFGSEFGDDDSDFEELPINFFRGYGTNGWEFQIPSDFEDDTALGDSSLVDALVNLAYFAGDPEGAFPPVQEADTIHPIPELTEWGNFSNLRRALFDPQSASEAKIADNSYMQTSAMLLGALAYNVSYLDAFDYEANKLRIYNPDNPAGDPNSLVEFLEVLNNGDVRDGEVAYFPDENLNRYSNGTSNINTNCSDINVWNVEGLNEAFGNRAPTMDDADGDDPDDRLCKQDGRYIPSIIVFGRDSTTNLPEILARIPVDYAEGDLSTAMPEAYLLALEKWLEDEPGNTQLRQAIDLERLLIDKEQVDRDRKFGFKATPKQPIPEAPAEDLGFYQYSIRFIPEDADLDGTFDVFDPTEDDSDAFATNRTEDLNGDNRVAFSEGIGLGSDPDAWEDPAMGTTTDDIIDNDVWDFNIEDINDDDALDTDLMVEEVDRDMDMEISVVGEDYNYNRDLQEGDDVEVNEDIFRNEELDINEGRFDDTANKWVWTPAAAPGDPPPDPEDVNDANGNTVWDTAFRVNLGCNYRTPDPDNNIEGGSNYLSLGDPANEATWEAQQEAERRFLLLASAVCPSHAKYPSLYYLFPKDEHTDYQAVALDLTGDGEVNDSDNQPLSVEEDLDGDGELDFYEDLNRDGVLNDGNTAPSNINDPDFDPIVYLSRNGSDLNSYIGDLPAPTFRIVDESDLTNLTIGPKKIDDDSWGLPYSEEGTSPPSECDNDAVANKANPNCSQYNLVALQEENLSAYRYYRVGFKDTAFFDGRELMSLRFMNTDMEMLTDKAGGQENGTVNGEGWLTLNANEGSNITGGVVYAAREDAVREDAIARPASSDWTAYQQAYQQNYGTPNENLRMDADVPQDPPVSDPNQISPKPIDFYPDPDRRPYGFRLINGSDISRGTDNAIGMTLVTDNPVYIKGNFNCHGECNDQIEEFSVQLQDDYSNFYTRNGLNIASAGGNFTDPGADSWRTTEILTDAGGILSDRFCDGSIADSFVTAEAITTNLGNLLEDRYGCNTQAGVTSYFNHGLVRNFSDWVLENPARDWQAEEGDSIAERYENLDFPIKISSNGNPLCIDLNCGVNGEPLGTYWEYPTDDTQYFGFNPSRDGNQGRRLPEAQETYVNVALFSGIIPSRAGQNNGSLNNFPRFLEDWSDVNLHFSGSLMQLTFSNAATAPFYVTAWEPDEEPAAVGSLTAATNRIAGSPNFYWPPERIWGYDVAMQLVPAAPVAQRLLAVGNARSEFYSEPEADDPYIQQLRCTVDNSRPGC